MGKKIKLSPTDKAEMVAAIKTIVEQLPKYPQVDANGRPTIQGEIIKGSKILENWDFYEKLFDQRSIWKGDIHPERNYTIPGNYKMVDHEKHLIKAFKKDGNLGVDRYITRAHTEFKRYTQFMNNAKGQS